MKGKLVGGGGDSRRRIPVCGKDRKVTNGRGYPGSSVGKESICNAGDPSSIPREGIGYPFQYSWTSRVAQTVKNPPAMWETWV